MGSHENGYHNILGNVYVSVYMCMYTYVKYTCIHTCVCMCVCIYKADIAAYILHIKIQRLSCRHHLAPLALEPMHSPLQQLFKSPLSILKLRRRFHEYPIIEALISFSLSNPLAFGTNSFMNGVTCAEVTKIRSLQVDSNYSIFRPDGNRQGI